MTSLKIAYRNLIRSKKRSGTAMMVIVVSTLAMLAFKGFVENIQLGFGTSVIRFTGHFGVFKKGYSDFGLGKLENFVIQDWREVENWLMKDPYLKGQIENIQPRLDFGGLVGYSAKDSSTNFFGFGSIPSLREKFYRWDGYRLGKEFDDSKDEGLRDWDVSGGTIGLKLAETLRICAIKDKSKNDVPDCNELKNRKEPEFNSNNKVISDDRPKIQLLSGLSGAPNIINMSVAKTMSYGDEETDSSFISLHLSLAQRLVFSKSDHKVSGVFFQIKDTNQIFMVKKYLNQYIKRTNARFEIRDYLELFPVFKQVMMLFTTIFIFVSFIMAITALFSINNTMVMCVMERVSEIGTLRSMGLNRNGVLSIFLIEGLLLGIIGSTLGILVGGFLCFFFNSLEPSWVPPSSTEAVPIRLQVFKSPIIIPQIWLIMVVATSISAVFPARKAANLNIVDALRDV